MVLSALFDWGTDHAPWSFVALPSIFAEGAHSHDSGAATADEVETHGTFAEASKASSVSGALVRSSMAELKALSGGKVRIDLLNNNNSQYYGDFALGHPKQRFTAIFDTGSGTVWVPGASCKSQVCEQRHRFDSASSEAFEEAVASQSSSSVVAAARPSGEIRYGTGTVSYEEGRDTLSFCDSHSNAGCNGRRDMVLEMPGQPIGMSTDQTNYPFSILPFDGILGLAPSVNRGSVLHQIRKAGALARNLFGVYLSEDTHRSGSVSFGGVELQHIAKSHPLHWHKIMKPNEWTVGIKDITVNGEPLHLCDRRVGGVCPAVVDTGSSLLTGPQQEIEKLLSRIHTDINCKNLNEMPNISVQIVDDKGNLVDYPLAPKDYTLRSLEEVRETGDFGHFDEFPVLGGAGAKAPDVNPVCEPGIGIMDVPGKKWVIGDTFLRRYYSIYDDDHGKVGFVRSIHPDETPLAAAPVSASTTPGVEIASAVSSSARNDATTIVTDAAMSWVLGLLAPVGKPKGAFGTRRRSAVTPAKRTRRSCVVSTCDYRKHSQWSRFL